MNKLQKASGILSISLLLITAINAIIAGILFIIDPSGGKIGMTTTYLSASPFKNFLIPGITLLVVNGLLNLLVAVLTIKKIKYFAILIIIQGILLSGWIILQVIWIKDFNTLHLIMLSIGILLIFFGLILRNTHNSKDPKVNTGHFAY